MCIQIELIQLIEKFEKLLGESIPAEYKNFLLTVGNGYNFLGKEEILGIHLDGFSDWRRGNIKSRSHKISELFPFKGEWQGEELNFSGRIWDQEDRLIEEYMSDTKLNGSWVIYDDRSGDLVIIVLNGPCKGEIWIDSRTTQSGIFPVLENRCRVGFDKWFQNWKNEMKGFYGFDPDSEA